jgi:hypothetical protein
VQKSSIEFKLCKRLTNPPSFSTVFRASKEFDYLIIVDSAGSLQRFLQNDDENLLIDTTLKKDAACI